MPNYFDANTKPGWDALVRMASGFGWRDGEVINEPRKLTARELMMAIKANCSPVNLIVGHREELRRIYGASYWAARQIIEARKRKLKEARDFENS